LIRLVHDNEGLVVADNLLSGPPLRNESGSRITLRGNRTGDWTRYFEDAEAGNLRLTTPLPPGEASSSSSTDAGTTHRTPEPLKQ
jgi:hypothetical protein